MSDVPPSPTGLTPRPALASAPLQRGGGGRLRVQGMGKKMGPPCCSSVRSCVVQNPRKRLPSLLGGSRVMAPGSAGRLLACDGFLGGLCSW